jgi:hypothetical protein
MPLGLQKRFPAQRLRAVPEAVQATPARSPFRGLEEQNLAAPPLRAEVLALARILGIREI